MRKIAVITGTRAEYGLSRSIFEAIERNHSLELAVIVTGMHLMKEFGYSYRLIEEDGFSIEHNTGVVQKDDTGFAMAEAFGQNVISIAEALATIKPDIMMVLTDLGHTLAGAIAASHLNIPVAHVHGGDVSGGIDELIRHATTKFSHIHFPASELSAERLRRMGEEPWRIFMFGAPGIDEIKNSKPIDKNDLSEKYGLHPGETFVIVIQHPVTTEEDVGNQIRETISALKELKIKAIIIYPNVDAGGRIIIKEYQALRSEPYISMYKNIPRQDYLNLLKYASCMIGNSSSGIIEAPYFKLPVINIGTRQRNRQRAGNVIDVEYNRHQIVNAVKKAVSNEFIKSLDDITSPYGRGNAGEKMARVLAEIELNDKLINKVLNY